MMINRSFSIIVAVLLVIGGAANAAPASSPAVNIERSYVDGPFGQMHVRKAEPDAGKALHPPLVLFHPTPFSGAYFDAFMKRMANDRLVIAIDNPGYGGSTRPDKPQTIQAYANAIEIALDKLGLSGKKYDVLGYHTGGLIAAELALRAKGEVRRLVLPGMPFYTGEARKQALANNAKPSEIAADGAHLSKKWAFAALATDDGLTLEQAQANFNDMMRSYPYDWWAYYGVFTYESDVRLPQVKQPALLIATAGSLNEETKAAAALMPEAMFLAMPDIKHGLFAIHLDAIEAATRSFLDHDTPLIK